MNNTVTPIQPEKESKGINPLLGDSHEDTMERVKSVLEFLGSLDHERESIPSDEICMSQSYGRHLIYQTMIQALTVKNRGAQS